MLELQAEGKIDQIGLSEVSVDELRQVQALTPVASVQNRYNITYRDWQDVLEVCEQEDIAFIPWYPLPAATWLRAPQLSMPSPAHTAPRATRWPSRGCYISPPPCCRFPARPRFPISRRTCSASALVDEITDEEWAQLDAAV